VERGLDVSTPEEPLPRWVPLRAGIRNIWEYDEQVFMFAGGRMILRGPNGSGKSNALALIFPFLFDGTMSAAAMDPFAGGRSMRSLLLGVLRDDDRSGFRHDQRLGYVWLEFSRTGPEVEEYLTIGCGARATSSGDTRSWFFTTDRRVGIDLDLAPEGTPLTRGRLIEELGAGAVLERAEDHRSVVARDLLGVDADQLAKLNQLIRALRRPQLAGKLDLEGLSDVLSNGLPAVAPATLDDIAASLDDLERVQRELASVRDALATLHTFLPTYRAYLDGEARLRADVVISNDRSLAAERRAVADHRKEHERLRTKGEELRGLRSEARTAADQASAERDAIKDSGRYKDAQELDREEQHATALAAEAGRARKRNTDAAARAKSLDGRASAAEDRARETASDADQQLSAAADRADRVGAAWTIPTEEQRDPIRLEAAVNVASHERRDAISSVRKSRRALDDAMRDHRRAEEQRGLRAEAVDRATEEVALAEAECGRQHASLTTAVAAWLASAPGVDDERRSKLAGMVALVADREAVDLGERYRLTTVGHRDELRDQARSLGEQSDRLGDERAVVETERALVAAEEDTGPVPPAWRTADRAARPGAPLWACCDFAVSGSMPPSARAGLEAALDAAGLLDAWVSPSGTSGGDGDALSWDAWLQGGEQVDVGHEDAPRLGSLLEPVVPVGSGLDTETISAVLSTISVGRLGIAVDDEGRFALGPLVGRAGKETAEFIGATARADRRVRRLAELDVELARLDGELALLEDRRSEVAGAFAAWEAAADSAPDTVPLAAAAVTLWSRELDARRAVELAGEAAIAEQQAAAVVAERVASLDADGIRLRVPTSATGLDEMERGVRAFEAAGRDAVAARRVALEADSTAIERRSDAYEASSAASVAAEEEERAERDASGLRRRVDTLRERLGTDARDVFDDLAALELAMVGHDQRIREFEAEIEANVGEVGKVDGLIEAGGARIAEADARVLISIQRLPVLRGRDLLALLGQPADDLPLEPIDFARWMADRLGGRPADDARERDKKAFDKSQKQLLDDLHQGYAPSLVHDDDLVLVEVTSDDHSVFGLAVLVERLEQQVAAMEQHLTDGDRDVFERHLLNRVSHELRRLLGEADEFVRGVNEALGATATASGLRVELAWAPRTDEADVRKALDLLRRDTDQMGDDDRAALRRFFDHSIRRQRAEDPDAGYRANLEQVVDYRQWHRFQPFLIGPDGRARLTREKFRGLSGGEQAVALHLPLFAAAAAHYNRAAPTAPRLVALDEAFAGIDEAMRGELLGLTVAFDLDVFLTGHELWGAYAEVPQIAVHDLLRRPPAEGVSVFSLRWDGAELAPGDPDPSTLSVAAVDGLFASEASAEEPGVSRG
jgi:uncharacterized protein (TIGR02680 family)